MKKIAAIILAAGSSSRMGRSKQLLRINGVSFVRKTAETALASQCSHVFVVTGAQEDAVRTELDGLDVTIVANPFWHAGMGSSIRSGIQALKTDPHTYDAALFLLIDQPAVTTALLNTIIGTFKEGKNLVASAYADSVGVPALFAAAYFEALENLPADRGAKLLLKRHSADLKRIPFPEGAFDIDTQADFERLQTLPPFENKS
ncbi:nucleotidyltransferase family protein [Sulfurimonas sp. HSL3-7]|uniref:nucleotidyltransferase family protein n=1 Tax=Sulfonitrofixus jiaomeiensis TaxID=3131938 RepID=UPI0031F87BBF